MSALRAVAEHLSVTMRHFVALAAVTLAVVFLDRRLRRRS
jgi:hypothetical protein